MLDISWDLDPSKSVAQQIECDLVKHICNTVIFRSLLLDALEVNDPVLLASHVVKPVRRSKRWQPGDIDILICPTSAPEHAIAIECKRVPVFTKDRLKGKKPPHQYVMVDAGGRHQYRALKEGEVQMRKLYRLRFHRTYQLAIIATDGSGRWGVNPFHRFATPMVHNRIAKLRERPKIPPGVGLITIEIAETLGKPIQYGGQVSCQLVRPARLRTQPAPVTTKIARLLENPLTYLEEARVLPAYEGENDRPTLHYPLGLSENVE